MAQKVNAYTQDIGITVETPTVYYFTDPVRGLKPFADFNYTLITGPASLPSYSIGNVQDFYLTSRAAGRQQIVPLFLNLPDSDLQFGRRDSRHTVTAADEFRVDLISYRFYGTVEYWWIILLANDVIDPFSIKQNTILRIPDQGVILSNWLSTPVSRQRRVVS